MGTVYVDTVPPCRAYVHYYTVPEGKGKHCTVLEGQHVYCIQGNNGLENSYQPIPDFVCCIETLIPRALPSGFVLLCTAYKPRE